MNGYAIQQNTAAQDLVFLMISSADHISPLTGATVTVNLRKNGNAIFGLPAGAVSEIANGWYRVAGNATDSNTLGPLCLNAKATGADPTDMLYMVVAYNPLNAVNLGLSALPAAAANTAGGLGICDATLAVPAFVQAYAFNQDPWTLTWYGAIPAAGFPANSAGEALVAAGAGGNPWMAFLPGTYTGNQAGAVLYAISQSTGDPWNKALPGAYAAGTAGNIIGSRLDANISSRSTYAGGAVASVTGSVGGSVGSVTGAVGSVTGSVGSVAAPVIVGGYSTNQDPRTMVLNATAASYNTPGTVGAAILAGGVSGDPWATALPGAYAAGTAGNIIGSRLDAAVSTRSTFAGGAVASVTGSVGSVTGAVGSVTGSVGSVAGAVNSVISPITVGAYSSGQDPATRVLNAVMSGYLTTGSVGAAIQAGAASGDPWSTALPGSYVAGTAGNIIGSRLDAAVSSRSTYAGGPVTSVTGSVGSVTGPVIVGSYSAGQDPRTMVLNATIASYNTPGSVGAAIASAGSAGDPWATMIPGAYATGTAGNILGNRLDASISTRSTYAGGPVASVTGSVGGSVGSVVAPVIIDLTRTVPRSNAAETVGDCLMGARAQGLGAWTLLTSATPPQLVLYASDNATPIRTFTLDSATAPTMRY